MKLSTKLSAIIALLLLYFSSLHGQDLDLLVKEKMDVVFAHLDKSKIGTGLLSDYGCLLVEPYAFNGTLAETNYVSPEIWKGLYLSMYTTRINESATLKEPELIFNSLRSDAPALLYLQYNRLDEQAMNNGLLVYDGSCLRETGNSDSLYLKNDLFAVTLPDITGLTPQASFTFRRENYISNSWILPTQVDVCFSPESGYQKVTWGQPISHTFSSFGVKEIKVRIKFSKNKTLESHARIRVDRTPVQFAANDNIDASFAIAATSAHNGGRIQIKYAAFNKEKKKLMRPLVIADESDVLKYITGGEINLEYLLRDSVTYGIMEQINNLYDLVYVDNNDGFDDIFRNARLFEDALERINGMRNQQCDSTCVIGLGMGGLVARYALKEWENRNAGHHNVSKLITINSPHKGLNVPIGVQGLLRHLNDIRIVKKRLKDLSAQVERFCDMLDRTAMRQMLTYSIDGDFNYRNDHADFMRKYDGMGMPSACRNIAVSNGTCDGRKLFNPGARFMEMEMGNGLLDIILGMFCASTLKFESRINALNDKAGLEVYYGNLYFKTYLLLGIPIKFNCNKKTLDSTDEMVALDGAPGSSIALKSMLGDGIGDGFKFSGFSFVSTASALAVNDWEKNLYNILPLKEDISGFDKLYAPEINHEYTALDACKEALLRELAPQITGKNNGMVSDTPFELNNIPPMFKTMLSLGIIKVDWQLSNDNFRIVSNSGLGAVITPVRYWETATLKAKMTVKTGSQEISYETLPVTLYSKNFELTGSKFISPSPKRYSVTAVPSGATLTWILASNLEVVERKDNYVVIRDKSGKNDSNDLWITAKLASQGNVITRSMTLKRARVEKVELECLQNKVVDVNGERKRRFIYQANVFPQDIPYDEYKICWSTSAYKKVGAQRILNVGVDVRVHEEACYGMPSIDDFPPVFPVRPLSSLGGNEIVQPDEYDFYWPSTNSIVSYVPQCQLGDSIFGSVTASAQDNYGNPVIVHAPLWNYYVTVVHIAPNPCSTTLIVTLNSPESGLESRSRMVYEPLTVDLYTDYGLVRSMRTDGSQPDIRMDVSGLPDGTYYLNVLKNGELVDRQVVLVKH